jgi:diguanylate cyclase (GGDEF)-like protein/PAS domain S-box-containing protein
LLSAIIDASDDAILSKTLDGIITSWNPAAERIFGYTAEEIIGKPKTILFPPDRLQEEEVILDRLQRGIATKHFETVRLRKDGTALDVAVTISPIRGGNGQVIGASTIARDITERKRAEEKVKLLSTVAAESVNGIVITDAQRRIVFVNPAYERLTGYTLDELRGRRPGEVLQGPDTDRETKQRVREALDAEQPVMAGLLNYHKNGTPYWIEIHITPVRDDTGEVTHYIAIETDITHRQQAQTALRQSHDKMTALIEAIPDIIFRVNRDGICLDNLGKDKPHSLVKTEAVVGKLLRDFVPPHVGEIVQAGIDAALATGKPQSLQYQFEMDGIVRHRDTRVVAQSEDIALVVVRDVTDSKAIEQALHESQAQFQAFINQGFLYAWITDADGQIEYLNAPYCAMIGRTLEECRGKTPFDLYPPDVAQVMIDNIRQVAQTGETLETVEIAPMPDGKPHYFLVHKFLLGEMKGRVLVGGSAIDITARVQAEQAIRDNVEQQAIIIAAQQGITDAGHDLDKIMQIAAACCQSLTTADGADVELVEGDEMVYAAVSGTASPYLGLRLKQGNSLSGKSVRGNEILYCEDSETDSRVDREACRKVGVRSMVVVPLQKDGQAIGVLKVLSSRPRGFAEGDRAVLQLMAGFLASAMLTAVTSRELRRNEERLREAQQVAHIGSWELNLITGQIFWSEEMFHLYRIDPAEGMPSFDRVKSRIHPEDWEMYQRILAAATDNKGRYEYDLRLLFEDGAVTWGHAVGNVECDETGRVVRRFGTFMDVTAQKQTELALRKSQENLNHAQAIAHVGSWERDYRAGTMVWSDELFRLCGLEPCTIVPTVEALFAYFHPLDRQLAQEHMERAIREGTGANYEQRLVGADGVLRHIHLRTEILTDEAGQSIGSHGTVTDITERVMALQEQTKFVSLIENSSDFIAMFSLDGMLLTMNPAGRKLVGLERGEEVTTRRLPEFMPTEVWNWMQQGVLPIVMRDDQWEGECQLVNVAIGKTYDMQASFFLIRNPQTEEPMCLATVQRDITEAKWRDGQLQQYVVLVQKQNLELEMQRQELESANAHLAGLATTDGLTGAKNHRAFQDRLSEEYKRVERVHAPFSVVLLDVDRFKQYNDQFGHPEGDRVLKQVVRVLQETVRATDFVARYGGEEFILLLPETGAEGAMEVAERLRVAIEAQDWPLRPVTASFGVATLNASTETVQQMIDVADKALYASKAAGRNRVTHADAIPASL